MENLFLPQFWVQNLTIHFIFNPKIDFLKADDNKRLEFWRIFNIWTKNWQKKIDYCSHKLDQRSIFELNWFSIFRHEKDRERDRDRDRDRRDRDRERDRDDRRRKEDDDRKREAAPAAPKEDPSKKKRRIDEEDAYAELYPMGIGMLDPGGESDEDADYSKMDMVRIDFWCFKGLFCLILSSKFNYLLDF